jgi:hypothetical protein
VAPSNPKEPTRREIRKTREQVEREYAWILALANEDDSGSLKQFFNWITSKFIENQRRDVPLDLPFTQKEFDDEFNKTAWKQQYTSFEAEARRQQADPRLRNDWLDSINRNKETVQGLADQYGVQLSDDEVTEFATQSRLQNWSPERLRRALQPLLERTILESGTGGMGLAGDAESDLVSWARRNGLTLSPQAAAQYISKITFGQQSLDSVKDDIRKTYLRGMFPAWADRIDAGFDPEVIFEPYRDSARRLLEVNEIDFDDPLMKRAAQYTGPDGKASQLPLYQFEEQIRNDPRWQYTDNAYKTYTDVGTDLLRMFGFR